MAQAMDWCGVLGVYRAEWNVSTSGRPTRNAMRCLVVGRLRALLSALGQTARQIVENCSLTLSGAG
jgi:hypothetical protein